MSDSDLASLYGVYTGAFNQAIKRNLARFPNDFSFVLTQSEFRALMSQIVISKGRGGRRKLPRIFTEHGAIMAATILNSPRAAAMSVYVVRAFVRLREELNHARPISNIVLFEHRHVRRAWNPAEQKWYFAIADVIAVLTGSADPGAYWRKLKERLKKEGIQTVTDCHALKMTAADGKQRLTDVADTEQVDLLRGRVGSTTAQKLPLPLNPSPRFNPASQRGIGAATMAIVGPFHIAHTAKRGRNIDLYAFQEPAKEFRGWTAFVQPPSVDSEHVA